MDIMQCTEPGCTGKVGVLWPASVEVSPYGERVLAFPCNACRRLYLEDGEPLCDHNGNKAFYKNWTCVVLDEHGQVVGIFGAYSVNMPQQKPSSEIICR